MVPSIKGIANLFQYFLEQDGRKVPYMVKTPKNLLLLNQESFGAESWYIALRTEGLPSL